MNTQHDSTHTSNGNGSQTPAARVAAIQRALRDAGLDGWLFYDFRQSDPLAYRILKLDPNQFSTRRWFYFVPAEGEPTRINHAIEQGKLDALPGRKLIYSSWQRLNEHLRDALATAAGSRVAMQYSPENSIPYISRVDAGTIELVRSLGAEPVTSADLVQTFEAVWTREQYDSHVKAADNIHNIIHEAFAEVARRIRADEPVTEYDIQQFMVRRFEDENMTCNDDHPIVSVNQNAASPHYQPNAQKFSPIKRGDFLLLDVWAKQNTPGAVYADQTWTGFVGETPTEEHFKVFQIVRDARDAAIEFVRESVKAGREIKGAEVDDVSRGVITRAGYGEYFTHRTGHSIGEEVHGNGAHIDNLETRDSRKIIPRTCFSIEPGIYLPGNFGVRSEIDLYVGDDGEIEVTGQPIQKELVLILK
ncbi:MAG TPA: M24 family metallopeptidase [Pyrinomonadaceae bacterium]|jgi:Xaa-Pro aminopeptidase|nr:M24 family metallopeptidase [Pyrinomonadaceae bacterium]